MNLSKAAIVIEMDHSPNNTTFMQLVRKSIPFGAEKLSLPTFALNHCVENVTIKNRINNKFIDFFGAVQPFSQNHVKFIRTMKSKKGYLSCSSTMFATFFFRRKKPYAWHELYM